MADDTGTPGAAAPATTPAAGGAVQDAGGGTLRVSTDVSAPGKTLEEEAAQQAKANETPEQKAEREAAEAKAKTEGGKEETPEQKAAREAADKEAPKPVDLKGTVFEGMSPEMQTKIAPYAAAFSENGTLTDAEVSEAAKATGFSEAAVRQFMAGASAETANAGKVVIDQFGGQAQFGKFQAWTKEAGNLTPREEATINKAVKAGDYETAAELMKAPMERWKAAGGEGPARDVTGEGAGGGGGAQAKGDVYGSWAEATADQAKPEYRNNPTFRKSVEEKIARSPLG